MSFLDLIQSMYRLVQTLSSHFYPNLNSDPITSSGRNPMRLDVFLVFSFLVSSRSGSRRLVHSITVSANKILRNSGFVLHRWASLQSEETQETHT